MLSPFSLYGLLLLFLIIFLMISGILFLLRRLSRCLRTTPCSEVPEAVDRRPDPCLYSQGFILRYFPGQPVTWDNPDITLTETDGTPVSSESILPSHDYIIHARIWNASFSPALGTLVRCSYHGFGFNSLLNKPVETNPDGTPKIAMIHIPSWQNARAEFRWHTPNTPGHYCLLVECSHPADSNVWNNLGQENTVVRKARRGDSIEIEAIIANPDEARAQQVHFLIDTYTIPKQEVELNLRTTKAASARRDAGELRYPVKMIVPRNADNIDMRSERRRFIESNGSDPIRFAYGGREAVLEANAAAPRVIPAGWRINLGSEVVNLAPRELRKTQVAISIPPDAALGPTIFNITSLPDRGDPGGITVQITVGA